MSTNNITVVRTIGKGERLTKSAVAEIIAAFPADFDHTKRGALAERVHFWASPDGVVPAMTNKDKSRTDYGNGVNTIVTAIKRELATPNSTVALRVSLSGEGGGTTTIAADHPMYATLVALVTGAEQTSTEQSAA